MTALALLPATLVAVAVAWAPGLLATLPCRLGLVGRVAASGLASIALLGAAGILAALVGVPYGVWLPVLLGVLVGGVGLLAQRRRPSWVPRRRDTPHRAGHLWRVASPRAWAWPLGGFVVAGVVIAIVALSGIAEPDRVSQTYDNVFHLSAIARILETGDASSLTLRTMIETDRSFGFYPAGWHTLVASVVQLTGTSIPVATNAAWWAVAAAVWVPGSGWLAQVLLRRRDASLVAAVAMPIAACFGAMPYALLSWGTIYPTFLATALLPAALAVAVLVARAAAVPGRRVRGVLLGLLALAVAGFALLVAQPRGVATWILLLLPGVVVAAAWAIRRAWRAGPRARRRLVWSLVGIGLGLLLLASAAAFYAIRVLQVFERPLAERLGGPQAQATQSILDGIVQVLLQAWPTGVGTVAWPALLLAAVVVVGGVVVVRTRGIRWILVSYALAGILFALAAGSDDIAAKLLTAVWYKDRFRLSSAVVVIGVVLATAGILALAGWWSRSRRGQTLVAAGLTLGVVATSSVALVAGGETAAVAHVFRMPDRGATTEVVSRAQIAFMARLPEWVPAGERVLGDPWDGSAWTGVFGDREPVFPHVNGQWDADRLVLAYGLQDIATDPATVCAALDALDVRYVLYHPHALAGGDPIGNHFPAVHTAVKQGLFTEVATDGDSTLYRIDSCGPLPR